MTLEDFKKERTAALFISIFATCALSLSLLLHSLLAAFFGASSALDAFAVGNSLPYLLINWFAYGAVSIILVPIFTEYRTTQKEEAIEGANTFITFFVVASVFLSFVCIAAAHQIVALIGKGLDSPTRSLAANITRVIMTVFPFMVTAGILSGLLRAYEMYSITPVARCVDLMFVIGSLIVLKEYIGIYAIPIGMIVGAVGSLVIHLYYARGVGQHFRINFSFRHEKVRTMFNSFLFFGLIGASSQLVFLVDRVVASLLSPGSVALYQFASRFEILIVAVLPVAVAIPFYTKVNEHITSGSRDELRSTVHHGIRLVAVASIPFLTLLVLLRIRVVELWLQRGAFTPADTRAVASVFLCLAPGLLVLAFAPLCFHIYFALKDTKPLRMLTLIVMLEVFLNITLDLILVRPFGLKGIALATSIVKLPGSYIAWTYISHYLEGLRLRAVVPHLVRVMVATSCMVPIVLWVQAYLRNVLGFSLHDRCLALGIPFVLGASVFLIFCSLFRVREVTELRRALFGKFLSVLRSRGARTSMKKKGNL